MRTLRRLSFVGLFVSLISVSFARLVPEALLPCKVGSFDARNVQLKCGKDFKERRQMNRAYFEKIYGEATEGKTVKINTNSTATAGQLKSY